MFLRAYDQKYRISYKTSIRQEVEWKIKIIHKTLQYIHIVIAEAVNETFVLYIVKTIDDRRS